MTRAKWLTSLAVAVAVVHYVVMCARFPLFDDYYTFLRYADNALHGHGLTYNAGGERVEGYTSFAYLLVLVAGRAVGASPYWLGRILNGALFALVPVAGARLARSAGSGVVGEVGTAWLLATSHTLCLYACWGVESMLLVLLMIAALDAFMRDRPAVCGVLAGVSILARPEMMLMLFVLSLLSWRAKRRGLFVLIAGALAVVCPHLLWRRAYYGFWFPNSYYAKVAGPVMARIGEGVVGAHRLAVTPTGGLVVVAGALCVLTGRRKLSQMLVALAVVFSAALLWEGVDHWLVWWHAAPLGLTATLLLGDSLAAFRRQASAPPLVLRGVVTGALALYAVLLTVGLMRHPFRAERFAMIAGVVAISFAIIAWRRRWVATLVASGAVWSSFHVFSPDLRPLSFIDLVPSGIALAEVARPGDTLATGAAGAIPYTADLFTYDTLGVNELHIAHQPLTALDGRFGHHRGDGTYVMSKKPNLLLPCCQLTEQPGPCVTMEKTFLEMFASPEFATRYEPRSHLTSSGLYLNYYRLRETTP